MKSKNSFLAVDGHEVVLTFLKSPNPQALSAVRQALLASFINTPDESAGTFAATAERGYDGRSGNAMNLENGICETD